MIEKMVARYFDYAEERYNILLSRERGEPRPWTADPILQSYRFCNVFREDDITTRWIRVNVRKPLENTPEIVYAMAVCRFFNRIDTLAILESERLLVSWDPDRMRRVLADHRPLVTGAYMLKTPLRKPKLEGLIEILEPLWHERSLITARCWGNSLQSAHAALMDYSWVGPFMSYEIVTDLRHTPVLREASDIMSWANAGPGATRGIMRILTGLPDGNVPEARKLKVMRALLAESRDQGRWPPGFPPWEMREVEHGLCEFDKYERARTGEGRPKQKYDGV